jgi:putative flippase GtrA
MATGTSQAAVVDESAGSAIRQTGRQLPSFVVIGVLSTAAYLVLYAALRTVTPSYVANTISMAVTAVANTAANRRFTFNAHDAEKADRRMHQVKGGVAFLVALALTNGSLLLLHIASKAPAHWVELAVLVFANLLATVARFVMMKLWVFREN